MSRELPDEVYVITRDGEWPLTLATTEIQAISAYESRVRDLMNAMSLGADRSYAESRVHIRRCRLEIIEEMQIIPPGKPRLAPKDER